MFGSHAGDSARGGEVEDHVEVVGDVGARDGDTGGDAEYAGDVIDEAEDGVLGDAGAEDRRGGVL